jgi:hypothetical protein
MRRWLVAVAVVLLVAELTVRSLTGVLPPPSGWPTDEFPLKDDRTAELADEGGTGVVIVGSSVADVSVDPTALHHPRGAYNAGLVGATSWVVDVWTRLLVVPRLDPDVVIVAVSSRDLNDNSGGAEESDETFRRSAGGRWLLGTESTADRVERWFTERSALLRYREVLRRPVEALAGYDPPDRDAAAITELGLETHLLDTDYRLDDFVDTFFRTQTLRDFALGGDQEAAFRRLVTSLAAGDRRVVVLDVPVTADYVALHPRGADDMADYRAAVDAVVTETGAELVRPGVWASAFFSDPLHLNGAGVERLGPLLAEVVATG